MQAEETKEKNKSKDSSFKNSSCLSRSQMPIDEDSPLFLKQEQHNYFQQPISNSEDALVADPPNAMKKDANSILKRDIFIETGANQENEDSNVQASEDHQEFLDSPLKINDLSVKQPETDLEKTKTLKRIPKPMKSEKPLREAKPARISPIGANSP